MPCDAILLEGICTVNESEITGESNLEMKMPITKNNLQFSFSDNKNSLLLDGIKIVETKSSNCYPIALVINTASNTYKANLLRKSKKIFNNVFVMQADLIKFAVIMTIISVMGVISLIIISATKNSIPSNFYFYF